MRAFAAVLAFASLLSAPAIALTKSQLSSNPPCALLDSAPVETDPEMAERREIVRNACRLPLSLDAARAQSLIGTQQLAISRDADSIIVLARSATDTPALMGGLGGPLERIGGTDIWASRFHLAELDRAMLMVGASTARQAQPLTWRGPNAPPMAQIVPTLQGQVLQTTLRSEALGETRRLRIYLPPGHHAGGNYPAVFMADGASVPFYARIVEPLIAAGEIEPVVLVGAESGQRGIVEDRSALGADIRAIDYVPNLPGDDGARFRQHMVFFSQELVDHAVQTYSVSTDRRRRAVTGHSAGGALAFWAGYQRPDVFGTAIVVSLAGVGVGDLQATAQRARFMMSAGLYEAPFLYNSRRAAAELRAHGYDVTLVEAAAGHASEQDQTMLLGGLRSLFSTRR